MDLVLDAIQAKGVPVPFWGQGNQVRFQREIAKGLASFMKFRIARNSGSGYGFTVGLN